MVSNHYFFFLHIFLIIHTIKNIHTITSPNSIIAIAPPIEIANIINNNAKRLYLTALATAMPAARPQFLIKIEASLR